MKKKQVTRRNFLKGAAASSAALALPVGTADASVWDAFLQKHFKEMGKDELAAALEERMSKSFLCNALKAVEAGYGAAKLVDIRFEEEQSKED